MKKEEQAKIDNSRVRNMLDNLPKIRHQMAGYYDDLRKIEHDVYVFNEKFRAAIRAIYEVEQFYPGEEKAVEEKPKSNIILFPERHTEPGQKTPSPAIPLSAGGDADCPGHLLAPDFSRSLP